MKFQVIFIFITISILSCKQDNKTKISEKVLTVAEKIANAHGYQNWKKIKTFQFAFGGKLEDVTSGRTWIWNPKTDDVQLTRNNEVTNYNRKKMDSVALKADKAFINDKFWALIPFQLVWDEGTTISEVEKSQSPVNNETLNKITVMYSNEGGYTPGDAYDIYFDDNFIIREWSYRKGNSKEPSLSNTFENYKDFNGLKIAENHKKDKSDWNLLVRNVKVEIE